ncbi:hypothetical protein PM082_019320 [Marasmius tenuissimus]|nr:hypothetical protein PM082_019320 [Marasmius tenuissimus]
MKIQRLFPESIFGDDLSSTHWQWFIMVMVVRPTIRRSKAAKLGTYRTQTRGSLAARNLEFLSLRAAWNQTFGTKLTGVIKRRRNPDTSMSFEAISGKHYILESHPVTEPDRRLFGLISCASGMTLRKLIVRGDAGALSSPSFHQLFALRASQRPNNVASTRDVDTSLCPDKISIHVECPIVIDVVVSVRKQLE